MGSCNHMSWSVPYGDNISGIKYFKGERIYSGSWFQRCDHGWLALLLWASMKPIDYNSNRGVAFEQSFSPHMAKKQKGADGKGLGQKYLQIHAISEERPPARLHFLAAQAWTHQGINSGMKSASSWSNLLSMPGYTSILDSILPYVSLLWSDLWHLIRSDSVLSH